MKLQYLRRSVHDLACQIALCLDEESYRRELKRLRIEDAPDWQPEGIADASVVMMERGRDRIALVCLPRPPRGVSREQVYAMLVHEAVHVWRWHCRLIGEDDPSEEFECYGIQAISQRLMCAYADAKKR